MKISPEPNMFHFIALLGRIAAIAINSDQYCYRRSSVLGLLLIWPDNPQHCPFSMGDLDPK